MNTKVEFKVVRFDPNGDGVTALYVDDILYYYGDYYHDRVDEQIRGFKKGLEFAEFHFAWFRYECEDEETNRDICEYAEEPKKDFKNLKGIKQI